MIHLLAEGGYQSFLLSNPEKTWLYLAMAAAVVAIIVAVSLVRGVLAADQGTASMKEIALAVQEGAEAFLSRQFKTILVIVVPLAVLIFFTATKVTHPGADGTTVVDLTFFQAGIYRVICFLAGALCSGLTGFIGMSLAVRGNVRTAAAAREGKMAPALKVAFRTGAITGLFCVGLGLLGATVIVLIFQNTATSVLIGFGFGASLLALFMRVGGGIFTKAADVGADLVGKVEAGIPEDDPRNAATIADNVGDNVGDCAGMAADLFESYAITIIAAIILGVAAFVSIGKGNVSAKTVVFPLIIPAIGIIATIIGIFLVRAMPKDKSAMAPINRGVWIAAALTIAGTAAVAGGYLHYWKAFYAVLTGVILMLVASAITEQFTSTERGPVREIAEAARTGPATTTLAGIAIGLESSVWAIVAIAVAIAVSVGLGGGNIELTLYLISLTGIGLLSTAGMIVSEDSFGPVSDNAAGIAEMSGEFTGEAERVMVSLDAVGNTTKAVTKGVAIGSAVIASVSLFASFIETVGSQLGLHAPAIGSPGYDVNWLFNQAQTQINVSHPTVFIGLLIGGSIAFLFSSLAIRAVGRTAGTVVQEVRRQFREHPGIMDYTEKPEYGRVISICTTASQRELATPALLAVLTPVIIGFGINYFALGAFLAGTILSGQLMANFLSNSGGAWDNAKKYIEDGHEGGKGSEAHKAAVIGDTIGDPFKDTAGPALNPMIKVMNLVSLLILPAVITLHAHTGARLAIAGGALVVLLVSIAFSKRKAEAMDTDLPASESVALDKAATAAVGSAHD
ncbi:MAG TPA: sodium-translocating pyrophosphatase [Acidimicrobiales bacterium]|jgi:K(+)-stimulated pyrophosphate-energized sodium pump|nr:sodium-translocating pyrophosphatase [Acidimicrobiales bacterium]